MERQVVKESRTLEHEFNKDGYNYQLTLVVSIVAEYPEEYVRVRLHKSELKRRPIRREEDRPGLIHYPRWSY